MHSWQGGGFDFDDNDDNGNNNGTSLDQRTGSEDGIGPDWTGQDQIGGHGFAQGDVILLIVIMTCLLSS